MSAAKLPRVYIETSVWNFVFVDDAAERRAATQQFFDEVRGGSFDPYLSRLVLAEIAAAPEPRRSQLSELVASVAPSVLESSQDSKSLAADLIAAGMVPAKYASDALHIAIAVVENMDLLLSWNFKHIVKMKTRRMVSAATRLAGYKEVELWTPEEVIDDQEH
jgi:predicted nucleic acid-binding protein